MDPKAPQEAPTAEPALTPAEPKIDAPASPEAPPAPPGEVPTDPGPPQPTDPTPLDLSPGGFVKELPQLPMLPTMPEPVVPAPEPAQPVESWQQVTPGTPAFPVKLEDGTFAAGGLVKETLCVGPDGRPRCTRLGDDNRCHGAPTEEMRQTMTRCIQFKDRHADLRPPASR